MKIQSRNADDFFASRPSLLKPEGVLEMQHFRMKVENPRTKGSASLKVLTAFAQPAVIRRSCSSDEKQRASDGWGHLMRNCNEFEINPVGNL